MELLKDIIKGYNESKLAFVEKITESEDGIYDELKFLDDGYILVKINRLKKESMEIQKNLNMLKKYGDSSDYIYNQQRELSNRLEEIRFEIVFLASNNLNNVDSCLNLINGLNSDFEICIRALKYYNEENESAALECFHKYFKGKNILLEHYLVNKIYGTMMYKLNQLEISAKLLRKAAEKRPEDIEVHKLLKQIYTRVKFDIGLQIEDTIINLLEGVV